MLKAIALLVTRINDKKSGKNLIEFKIAIPSLKEVRTPTFMCNDIPKCNRNLRYWISRLTTKTYRDPSLKLEYMTLFEGKTAEEAQKAILKIENKQFKDMLADLTAVAEAKTEFGIDMVVYGYVKKSTVNGKEVSENRTSMNYTPFAEFVETNQSLDAVDEDIVIE